MSVDNSSNEFVWETPESLVSASDYSGYVFPDVNILDFSVSKHSNDINYKEALESVFDAHKIEAEIMSISRKLSSVTIGVAPGRGVRIKEITAYKDEYEHVLNGKIEFEIPLAGTTYLGMHLFKNDSSEILLRDLLQSEEYTNSTANIPLLLGLQMSGTPLIEDLESLCHLLIVGLPASGKSMLLHSIILGMLYKKSPEDIKFVIVDVSRVNIALYSSLPHNISPVINDPENGRKTLSWCLEEINRRAVTLGKYRAFKSIDEYNRANVSKRLPHIVVIIDDYSKVISSSEDIEVIISIASAGRAAGVHLILSTQNSLNGRVMKKLKFSFPARIAFTLSNEEESRLILDAPGAENLTMPGEMLFTRPGMGDPVRIRGINISDNDITNSVQSIKSQNRSYQPFYSYTLLDSTQQLKSFTPGLNYGSRDPMYNEVFEYVVETQKASTSLLQRRFGIGYDRASRLLDALEGKGVISPARGSAPREVYVKSDKTEDNSLSDSAVSKKGLDKSKENKLNSKEENSEESDEEYDEEYDEEEFDEETEPKKKRTWLWVLGWIFAFPIPLSIIVARSKSLNSILKFIILFVLWTILLMIAIL